MTQTELARRIGIDRAHISELIRAKRPMTADVALRLKRVFGMSAQFWLNLQMAWDVARPALADGALHRKDSSCTGKRDSAKERIGSANQRHRVASAG